MNKKILLLALFVITLGAVVIFLFMIPKSGVVVLTADPEFLPFTVKTATIETTCENIECSVEVDAGKVDIYMEKDGYYAQNEYFDLKKGETKNITVSLEVMGGVAVDAASVDEKIFENCYGDSVACENDFYIKEDADTGYMALWEGETRRATFTQGMTNAKIFTGGAENGVIVYDEDSGDAYFVDFVIDSRELAFNIDKNFDLTELKVFGGNEYLLKIGDSIFWQNYAEEIEVANGLDLEKFTYKDDYVYFMADSGSVADFIGNISASGVCVFKFTPGSYEAVLNDIEFSFEDAVLGSDESGVYGKSGGEVWRVE